MINLKQFITVLVVLVILDVIWLTIISKDMYQGTVRGIQKTKLNVKFIPAILTYPLIAWGICTFVLANNTSNEKGILGLMLGFMVYGIYNGTNYAIFDNWSLKTSIKDTLWGTALFGIVSLIGSKVY
jgi:uncharacterized membrane protein